MGSRCAVRQVAAVLVVVLVAMALLAPLTEAGYRKPTFNGSIFGKRAAAAAVLVLCLLLVQLARIDAQFFTDTGTMKVMPRVRRTQQTPVGDDESDLN
ncbi:hypothetical protein FJT64_002188 [Amphibalanus amphitrite]|uniref:Uncharacterized protein n=1 Tax=Amphibalanus amphitrite TaxID=1232801 RepID=A0A6A4WZY8_AMPAM|nr:hypothetical protein FJT64_002188 [Amphibalanus amphitrite]